MFILCKIRLHKRDIAENMDVHEIGGAVRLFTLASRIKFVQPRESGFIRVHNRCADLDSHLPQWIEVQDPACSCCIGRYLAASCREIDVWFVEPKRMRDISALRDHGCYILEEAVAGRVAEAPEHGHEFDLRLRQVFVFGSRRDTVIVIPGQAIVGLHEDLVVSRIESRDGDETAFGGFRVLREDGRCEKECEFEYREDGKRDTHREDSTAKWILDG